MSSSGGSPRGPEPEEVTTPGDPAPPPLRVLIVDDNRDGADGLRMLLERRGHRVEVAYDGTAALEAACTTPPDVMLVDIGLPGIDGYEVARRLRGEERLCGAYLVAITGYGGPEDRRRALAAGFDQHLTKPVQIETLLRLLGASRGPRPGPC